MEGHKLTEEELARLKPTPDMIEAGLKVFMEWHPDTAVGDGADRMIVREIYEAMIAVDKKHQRNTANVDNVDASTSE